MPSHKRVILTASRVREIAAIIITGLPESAMWALGLLVGVNLLFGGAKLIGVALAARNA